MCVLYIQCVCNEVRLININKASRKGEGELVWLREVVVRPSGGIHLFQRIQSVVPARYAGMRCAVRSE